MRAAYRVSGLRHTAFCKIAPGRRVRSTTLAALIIIGLCACTNAPPPDTTVMPPATAVAPESSVPAPPPSGAPSPVVSGTGNASDQDPKQTSAQRLASSRRAATQADVAAASALEQQCSQIRADIREQQIGEQEAPSTSVSEQIVQAKEAHSDQRIQKLQDEYDSLDCPATDGAPTHEPLLAAPAAAPNGIGAPGAPGTPAAP